VPQRFKSQKFIRIDNGNMKSEFRFLNMYLFFATANMEASMREKSSVVLHNDLKKNLEKEMHTEVLLIHNVTATLTCSVHRSMDIPRVRQLSLKSPVLLSSCSIRSWLMWHRDRFLAKVDQFQESEESSCSGSSTFKLLPMWFCVRVFATARTFLVLTYTTKG
jgi:hypothetical protein